jgi:RecA-family ATPase
LLVGAPKIGKSWLALNIGVAVGGTRVALGSVKVKTGDVLFLALEDSPRRLSTRLKLVLGAGAPAPKGLFMETQWPRLADGGARRLDEYLSTHPKTRLVVVDVLAKVRDLTDTRGGNAYAADYAAMTALKDVADKHKVAMLVLHHDRKAGAEDFVDRVSGTSGVAGAADTILIIDRARNSAEAKLLVTGRDVEEHEAGLQLDASCGRWSLLANPALLGLSPERRQLIELLEREPGLGPTAIAGRLQKTKNAVQMLLREMTDLIENDGSGHYSRRPAQT